MSCEFWLEKYSDLEGFDSYAVNRQLTAHSSKPKTDNSNAKLVIFLLMAGVKMERLDGVDVKNGF